MRLGVMFGLPGYSLFFQSLNHQLAIVSQRRLHMLSICSPSDLHEHFSPRGAAKRSTGKWAGTNDLGRAPARPAGPGNMRAGGVYLADVSGQPGRLIGPGAAAARTS